MANVLIPIPSRDFDPTEVAVSWSVLKRLGHSVTFATPDGRPGRARRWPDLIGLPDDAIMQDFCLGAFPPQHEQEEFIRRRERATSDGETNPSTAA
jgi:hypothetical protein